MVRLTLRSKHDGRFLARVVDAGGYPFVLDFGESEVIADASRRLQHGFSMWRYGLLVEVSPQEPEILSLLADHYVSEGVLVFFEEPTWHGREHSLEDRLPGPAAEQTGADPGELRPRTELMAALDDLTEDESTELIGFDDLPTVDDFLEPELDPLDLPEPRLRGPDEETEMQSLGELRSQLAALYDPLNDPPIVVDEIVIDDEVDD